MFPHCYTSAQASPPQTGSLQCSQKAATGSPCGVMMSSEIRHTQRLAQCASPGEALSGSHPTAASPPAACSTCSKYLFQGLPNALGCELLVERDLV